MHLPAADAPQGRARGGRGRRRAAALIVIGGVVLGAVAGAMSARRRGGRLADILHRALVGGIGLGLAGLIATVVIERLL